MAPRKSEKEKELADRERLTRMSRRYHAEQLEQALAGIHSDVMTRLMAQLEDLRSARALVDFIAAQDWESVDVDVRMTALHQINAAITRLRERLGNGTPINDALPGQPLTAFQLIRAIINPTSFPQPAGKSTQPGGVSG